MAVDMDRSRTLLLGQSDCSGDCQQIQKRSRGGQNRLFGALWFLHQHHNGEMRPDPPQVSSTASQRPNRTWWPAQSERIPQALRPSVREDRTPKRRAVLLAPQQTVGPATLELGVARPQPA